MILKIYAKNNPNEYKRFSLPLSVITDSYLDEELDTAPITLFDIEELEPFAPLSVASLYDEVRAEETYYMIATDEVVKNIGTGRATHTLTLIEPTKWLERFMVGSKTVTQPTDVDYTPIAVSPEQLGREQYSVYDVWPGSKIDITQKGLYSTPITSSEVQIFTPAELGVSGADLMTAIVVLDGVEIARVNAAGFVALPNSGIVTVAYSLYKPLNNTGISYYGEYSLAYVSTATRPRKTLADATESFICAALNLRADETPLFSLSADALAMLSGDCPELSLTSATLREGLDEIGKVIGAISVLRIVPNGDHFDFLIDFEKFCKNILFSASLLGAPCEERTVHSVESYNTALDSTAANLIQYGAGGAIFDPAANNAMGRTLRTEDATYRVTEGNAVIATAFPIGELKELSLKIKINGAYTSYEDITQFVYEATEYAALSSYTSAYPLSKAFALSYTIGQKNIGALDFTVENAVSTSLFSRPALVNIINKTFGTSYNNLNALDFTSIIFRVAYVPISSARVRLRKPSAADERESVLAYNQSAAQVDTRAYLKSMLGAALRMGNVEKEVTYIVPRIRDVPVKGSRIDYNGSKDWWLSKIHREVFPDCTKIKLTLTKGFNRLSAFIGVNQSLRLFEISERMSLDRYAVYEDFCRIGTSPLAGDVSPAICTANMAQILSRQYENSTQPERAFALAKGYDKNGTALTECFLPCVTYAGANVIAWRFGYEDNYSAGRRVDPASYGESYYKTLTDVRYTDLFGEVETLGFKISTAYNSTLGDADALTFANRLPFANWLPTDDASCVYIADTGIGGNRLRIKKDSREAIKGLTYQLNFVEGDGIIIAPNFANFTPFGGDTLPRITLYLLGDRLDGMSEKRPSKAYQVADLPTVTHSAEGFVVDFSAVSIDDLRENDAFYDALDEGEPSAWAICYGDTVLLGENRFFDEGDTLPTIYFNFYHKK